MLKNIYFLYLSMFERHYMCKNIKSKNPTSGIYKLHKGNIGCLYQNFLSYVYK